MGTNFYRVVTKEEIENRRSKLIDQITKLDLSSKNIERGFQEEKEDSWDTESPWDAFIEDTSVHLGKRSGGWKFCWNFHDKKYYSNKVELLDFIRSGRVVDEYGNDWDTEKFIEMALNWFEPDGHIYNEEYRQKEMNRHPREFLESSKYDDLIIDGLRVSSSTDFS